MLALASLLTTLAVGVVADNWGPKEFTPVDMLSTPRPQAAIAAPGGRHAISVVDQWNEEEDAMSRTLYILDLDGLEQLHPTRNNDKRVRKLWTVPTSQAHDFLWLSDHTVAYINGSSLLHFSIDPSHSGKTMKVLDFPEGTEPSGLQFDEKSHALVFSAAVWMDNLDLDKTAAGDKAYKERGDSGLVLDDLFIRHWDTWRIPGRIYTLGMTKLNRNKKRSNFIRSADSNNGTDSSNGTESSNGTDSSRGTDSNNSTDSNSDTNSQDDTDSSTDSKPNSGGDSNTDADSNNGSDSDGEFTGGHKFENILKGTGLYSQMDAIAEFSLKDHWVAVALKPNDISVATHTRMEVHVVDLDNLGEKPKQLTPGNLGAVSGVEFSHDGSKLAWLQMDEDVYESDKRVVTVHTFESGQTEAWTSEWDRSPDGIAWAVDSKTLYLTAEYKGRVLPYHLTKPGQLPTPLVFNGTTSVITPLTDSTFLLSTSSMLGPIEIYFLDLEEGDGPGHDPHKNPAEQLYQITHYAEAHIGGRLDDLKPEELWFKGDEGRDVMAWVLKPRGWSESDAKGSYPLAFLIHGGPQGAWLDSWSTRWNPAVYASAGYFVVAVNPTGSTGYGQDFCDRIQNHWGDRPFQDLLAGYHSALDKYPHIDSNRTAALGASYGGFMVNWINGHNDFGFKALVYHDGMLSTLDTAYSTEELWFPMREFGGMPHEVKDNYERWNPMNYVQNWQTPQLVVQGGLDFRLAESMGIATFTALQYQNISSRFLYFPDENHWVLKAHNSRRWHKEVLGWLDQWVGKGKK